MTTHRKVSRASHAPLDERQRRNIAAKKSLSVDVEVNNLRARAGELRRELHSGRCHRERRVKDKFRSGLDLMGKVRALREKRRRMQQKVHTGDRINVCSGHDGTCVYSSSDAIFLLDAHVAISDVYS